MIGEAGFHCRRHAKCAMNPAEVVIGEVKAVGRPKVVPLLAEGVSEPREAAHLHTAYLNGKAA